MTEKLTGLLPPPKGYVSSLPLMATTIQPLSWDAIRTAVGTGQVKGEAEFMSDRWHLAQRNNNCAGASLALQVMKQLYRTTGTYKRLSETYIYAWANGNRDAGASLGTCSDAFQRYGLPDVSLFPANWIYRTHADALQRANADTDAFKTRGIEHFVIRGRSSDETQRLFWTALALKFTVNVAVHAGSRFDRLDANGICGVDNGQGNHAVHVYGAELIGGRLVANAHNSWPKSWGRSGRMNLTWSHFEQTSGVHDMYAIRALTLKNDLPVPRM